MSSTRTVNHLPVMEGYFPLNVWFNIVSSVEFPTLVKAVGQTSRRLRVLTHGEMKRRHWELFANVVHDVGRFLELMREVDAIMGGSAVLQMACPFFHDVPDYDFFVPLDGLLILAHYLIIAEGYTMEDLDKRTGVNGCMVNDVEYLRGMSKQITLKRGSTVVDVVGVGVAEAWDRAESAIASAWTTLLTNYAGPDFLMFPYPTLTLMGRGLIQWDRTLHRSFPGGTRVVELEKYQERGYEFRTHADDWDCGIDGEPRPCTESWVCPLKRRAFGDAGCLWIAVGAKVERRCTTSWIWGGTPCPLVCDKVVDAHNEVHVDWCACN